MATDSKSFAVKAPGFSSNIDLPASITLFKISGAKSFRTHTIKASISSIFRISSILFVTENNDNWDASKYSSGIYFIKLNAGNDYQDIKKVLLVK